MKNWGTWVFQCIRRLSKIIPLRQGRKIKEMNSNAAFRTEFMNELNKAFHFFIKKLIDEDDSLRKLKIVFSGCYVPGEGEHKLLEYIRKMKKAKNFNPNEVFCIYGQDADLIMLSLTTHLRNILILRETMPYAVKIVRACKRYID